MFEPSRSQTTFAQRLILSLAIAVASSVLLIAPSFASDAEDAKLVSAAEAGDIPASYREAIRAYLEAQGSFEGIGQNIAYGAANETLMVLANSGIEVTEAAQSIVLEQAIQSYGKKFSDIDFLTTLMARVYHPHFTEAELSEMTAYFLTPVGKKSVSLIPQINQAGMAAIQEASAGITPGYQMGVDAQLRAAGILPTSPPTP